MKKSIGLTILAVVLIVSGIAIGFQNAPNSKIEKDNNQTTEEIDIEVLWNEDYFEIISKEYIDKLSIIVTVHYNVEFIVEYEVTNIKNNYKVIIENNDIIVE